MELTKLINLLKHLNKDLIVFIAVEFVGGWVYKNNKLVFDFESLYKRIPRPFCSISKNFIYSRGYTYNIDIDSGVELPITLFKTYTLSYIENQEYKEHEYSIEINTEGIKKIFVNREYGNITQSYALDFINYEINEYDTLYTEYEF